MTHIAILTITLFTTAVTYAVWEGILKPEIKRRMKG